MYRVKSTLKINETILIALRFGTATFHYDFTDLSKKKKRERKRKTGKPESFSLPSQRPDAKVQYSLKRDSRSLSDNARANAWPSRSARRQI